MTLSFITHLIQSYGYYAVFMLIALESMGIPLPGETALITAALYAGTTHHLSIVGLAAVATAAAVIGDNAGYWIGRTGGLRRGAARHLSGTVRVQVQSGSWQVECVVGQGGGVFRLGEGGDAVLPSA